VENIQFDYDFAGPTDYAKMYRQLGIQVVPAKMPREDKAWKRPVIKWRDYEDHIADDDTFNGWFGVNGEFRSRPNMGIITGNASDGTFVLDIDSHNHPEAKTWLDDLIDCHNHGLSINAPTQRTGGGGLQLLFKAPDGWVSPTNKTSMGVDIRGQGGFAMLPPSKHESGQSYEWIKGREPWNTAIPEAPMWLIEAIDELLSQFTKVERGERTESPSQATDAFGQIVDGREDYMTRLIWARVVHLYRECPFISDNEAEKEMREAFTKYDQNVKSRLFEPGTPNHILLEREGRGASLFFQKWNIAMGQWDGRVKEAAAVSAPEKKPDASVHEQTGDGGDGAHTLTQSDIDVYERLSICDIKALPDPKYLIEGIVIENSLLFMYGPPGCGKTFISLSMALSIAAGLPEWWGRKIHKHGPVVLLSSEGVADLKFRIMAWEKETGISVDDIPFYLIRQTINFMAEADVDKLLRTVLDITNELGEPPVLINVDTVSRVLPGADENLQKDMTLFISACDRVREVFGSTVAGIHHTSRNGNLRGSTVFDGAGDALLSITREEGAEIGEMLAKKIKSAPDGWKQNFRLKKVEIGDIKGSTSLYAEPTDIEVGDDGKIGWPSKAVCQQVLYAMQEAWSSKRPWSNHYHAKRDGRYASTIMASRWGIEPEMAEQMLETWLINEVIEVSVADHKTKARGLKVLRNLYDEGAQPVKASWYED
jgi:hypothetical protein